MKYPDMDSYIRQLQRSRGLTLQALSRMLGYSSQTSLTRLMQSTANRASLQQFSDRLHACTSLRLTREERNQLDDLIELHDIGEDFGTMVALRRLLRGEPVLHPEKMTLRREDGSLCSFMAHYGSLHIRRMLLLNSETTAIFNDLALLMEQGKFPLEHLLYSNGHSQHTVNCLRATMPVQYSPHYESYSYTLSYDDVLPARGLIISDALLCEYEEADGTLKCDLAVFTTPVHGELMTLNHSLDDLWRFLPFREKIDVFRLNISDFDLVQYNAFCADLERNRMVCRIKPDPGIEQIPLPILQAAMHDGAPPELLQSAAPLVHMFQERQQNVLEKREQQHHVFRRSALLRFTETGRLSDHLWCCRPFTPQERLDILRYIRHTLMALEGFHLYFLKDDDALRCDEIVLYEGKGLSIIKPDTDYDLNHAHAEILVTQPEFLALFKRFFFESTLRYRVESEETSLAVMDDMINRCELMVRRSSENINGS